MTTYAEERKMAEQVGEGWERAPDQQPDDHERQGDPFLPATRTEQTEQSHRQDNAAAIGVIRKTIRRLFGPRHRWIAVAERKKLKAQMLESVGQGN